MLDPFRRQGIAKGHRLPPKLLMRSIPQRVDEIQGNRPKLITPPQPIGQPCVKQFQVWFLASAARSISERSLEPSSTSSQRRVGASPIRTWLMIASSSHMATLQGIETRTADSPKRPEARVTGRHELSASAE